MDLFPLAGVANPTQAQGVEHYMLYFWLLVPLMALLLIGLERVPSTVPA